MPMKLKHTRVRVLASFLVMLLALPPGIMAQQPAGSPAFKPEELEQLAAPIALYPDSLVAQILMASTYPLEVVQAERFAKQNKNLKGDALTKTLEAQPWDPSVKSLVNFPQVLTMMSEKLDWTQKLGDAFLAQQKDLMDTIQKLRAKAQAAGNLKTTKEQVVIVEEKIIKIEPGLQSDRGLRRVAVSCLSTLLLLSSGVRGYSDRIFLYGRHGCRRRMGLRMGKHKLERW